MTKSEEIEHRICLLEKELQGLKVELSKLLSCIHEWGEVVFDPETINTEVMNPGIEEIGTSFRAPKPVVVTQPSPRQRWSRTCIRCGEKQYTYETKPIAFEPLFR